MTTLIPLSDLTRDRNYDFRSEGIYDPTGDAVYGSDSKKIGTVRGAMVEPTTGRLRYLIIDVGGWFTSKEVLLPVGMARLEDDAVYLDNLTKDQVKEMREYRYGEEYSYDAQTSDERVLRGADYGGKVGYRNDMDQDMIPTDSDTTTDRDLSVMGGDLRNEGTTGIGYNTASSATMSGDRAAGGVSGMTDSRMDADMRTGMSGNAGMDTASMGRRYDYRDEDTEDRMFKTPDRLRLLEERLVVDKERYRTDSVEVSKHVEMREQQVSVNLSHEELVIERRPVTESRPVEGNVTLGSGSETLRVDLEAERADVSKQAYVTEEVEIGKRTETETQTFNETVGREVLDVNRTGDVEERGSRVNDDLDRLDGKTDRDRR
ncbi:PRC and DUF2382 domain-containing protein [Deinococcus peraridilitoris]|uniref:Conserved domain protein, TIGR02271+C111 n=1 Tax=Deinococcus peraridilitoris (strain DSM 19664 / LMG 22246 / CIP 109416 / KR-200) TaxID=937777 RepID=L0A262_DEIPD|nr:PRC and DUF2382 domain-containing protein [Deinococcus peraridilitoris]AFZ67262.1 conserved domain protein, TIGR02271+C111 [Deinococcus peraridilitoris DSM 19664]